MTTSIKYIGTLDPYFEIGVTGKQGVWHRGQITDVSDGDAASLVATGKFELSQVPLTPAAAAAAAGGINSGVWRSMLPGAMPTLRLRMTGIGTVTMNSRNREVVVTGNVYTNTVSGAVIVDYAYPGDDATEFQIVLTGTATAEVI